MTDLELVRKCAKVAGIELISVEGDPDSAPFYHDRRYGVISYWPLTNKEQASDLQDALKMDVIYFNGIWWAAFREVRKPVSRNADKLRAIVECAAANVED